mgnify:CR=1 FL=1
MHNIILHCTEIMELEIFSEIIKKKNCKVQIITYWEDTELLKIQKFECSTEFSPFCLSLKRMGSYLRCLVV